MDLGRDADVKAIVLSPGPSLVSYAPIPADLTIGVNRAATLHSVDAWSCGDTPMVLRTQEQVIGSPILICPQVTMDAFVDHKFQWRGETFTSTKMVEFMHPGEVNWPWCSFLIGCLYAAYRGATEIEVFGADWHGKLDWDNTAAGMNRGEDRWREEQGLFNALSIVLGRRGVDLVRRFKCVWCESMPVSQPGEQCQQCLHLSATR